MDWNYLKYVEAIALTGSLSNGAKLLQIDTSTLSRSLQKIENDYGIKIFKREKNDYVVTNAGKAWVRCSQLVRGHIDELSLRSGEEPTIVVTSLEIFLNHFLLRHVQRFTAKLEFIGGDKSLDLSRREADIAIRFGKPKSGDYRIQKLFEVDHSVYVGREFRKSLPSKIAECPWIILNEEHENLDDTRWFRENISETNISYRVSSCQQILTVLQSAPVLGILPCYMGDTQDELVRFEPGLAVFKRTGWLVVHRELASQKHIRTFIDELKAVVKQI